MPKAYKCGKNNDGGCGFVGPHRWLGPCPGCGRLFDIREINMDVPGAESSTDIDEIVSIRDVIMSGHTNQAPRLVSLMDGFDFVVGGGLVKGKTYLLCGDPGAGKTTLLLHLLLALARLRHHTMYVTSEQFPQDIGQYMSRIVFGDKKPTATQLKKAIPAHLTVRRQTDLDDLLDDLEEAAPEIAVIDSIQMISNYDNEPGSAASIRATITALSEIAKEKDITLIIIAHVTKEGILSGPKVLEHHVDCFLFLQGSKTEVARYLKCESKNRYGQTPRTARFLMTGSGLKDCYQEDKEAEAAEAEAEAAAVEVAAAEEQTKKSAAREKRIVSAGTLTNIDLVLEVACEIEDCRGKKGMACSTKNGTREAGFHQSRVDRAATALKSKPVSRKKTAQKSVKKSTKKIAKKSA